MTTAITKPAPSSLSSFEDFDLEQLIVHADAVKNSGSAFLKLSDGKNLLRFLPGRPATEDKPKQEGIFPWYEHWYTNDKGTQTNHVCPFKSSKTRCAVCEREALLKSKATSRVDQQKAWQYEAKGRFHSNVIARNDPDKGAQIYVFGIGVMSDLITIAKDEAAGGKFWDPVAGFDILIEKSGKGQQTKYKVLPARNSTPLSKDTEQAELWLSQRQDLTMVKDIPTYEETKAMLEGESSDSDF